MSLFYSFSICQGTHSILSLPATCSAPVLMKLKELDYLRVLVFFCQLLSGMRQRVMRRQKMRRQCGCANTRSHRNMSKRSIHCQMAELQGTARCSQELGPGQEDVWYLSGLHLRVLNPMTPPLAAFSWLLTLHEVGTLFWENDCMPAPQEVCIRRSLPESWAVGKEIGKLLRQKCWIQRRRKDRLFLGAQRDRTGLAAN